MNNKRPVPIRLPKKSGGYIQVLSHSIAAVEPINATECTIYTSGGSFQIALSEQVILQALTPFK
ncbi:MAG: hypothetical protein AB7V04_03875 [Desulfomonilaceae bacterium]